MTDDVSNCSYSAEMVTRMQREVMNGLTMVLANLEERRLAMATIAIMQWEAARLVSSQNLA